jgi:hypothetical protein
MGCRTSAQCRLPGGQVAPDLLERADECLALGRAQGGERPFGGRVFFGVGAGAPWNVAPAGPGTAFEAEGLGIPFPSLAERFERLEELLQIAHQMWRGDEKPYQGRHYQLVRPLNSPNSVQRPHPPILIGGSGERKTLRLVARYADACNLFDLPGAEFADNIAGKLRVLREHCETAGRDYAEIEKTVSSNFDLGKTGRRASATCSRTCANSPPWASAPYSSPRVIPGTTPPSRPSRRSCRTYAPSNRVPHQHEEAPAAHTSGPRCPPVIADLSPPSMHQAAQGRVFVGAGQVAAARSER